MRVGRRARAARAGITSYLIYVRYTHVQLLGGHEDRLAPRPAGRARPRLSVNVMRMQAESGGLAGLLERRGIRPTRQRLRVLEALAGEPDDATVQEIHTRLLAAGERVGLATVYRTVAVLSEHGVIDTLSHRPGELCYRLCGDAHHHHLVCSECHRVVELPDCDLEPWLERISAAHGFVATDHRVEVTGVCAACRRRPSGVTSCNQAGLGKLSPKPPDGVLRSRSSPPRSLDEPGGKLE